MKICHLNITSARLHRDELLARYSDYDLISLNETNVHPTQKFNLPNFSLFRFDRLDRKGGGVIIAVKDTIRCHEVINKSDKSNEIVAVNIELKGKLHLFASIYTPPQEKLNLELFEQIYQLNNNSIVLGDLNAANETLGSNKTNSKGRQLAKLLEDNTFSAVAEPLVTYERNNYSEKLDWILATQPTFQFISNVQVHAPLGTSTGHLPLTFDLDLHPDSKPLSPRLSFCFSRANWNIYRRELNARLSQ
jgi:hypothetical protein